MGAGADEGVSLARLSSLARMCVALCGSPTTCLVSRYETRRLLEPVMVDLLQKEQLVRSDPVS